MKAFALGIVAALAIAGTANAKTEITDLDNNRPDPTFSIRCEADTPESLQAECMAAMVQQCPQGGVAEIKRHSGPGVTPYWVELRAACNVDTART